MVMSVWTFGLLLALSACSQALEIVSINVPQSIENGTVSSLVLDCDYNVQEDEKNGLVVKWYLRDIAVPVYQWVPGRKPQDLGLLKGKVNLEYRASEDYHKKYRSLNILNPTTELSGEYRCHVSTFVDEKESKATMTVYVLPKSVELWTVKPNPESVNVTCRVEGVYPEAKLELFREHGPRTRAPVSGAVVQTSWRDGKYDITLSKTLEDRTLLSETTFDCVVTIPGTEIQKTRRLTYLPSHITSTTAPSTEPETESTMLETTDCLTTETVESLDTTSVSGSIGYLEEMTTTTEFVPLLETESKNPVTSTLAHLSTTTSGTEGDDDGYTSPRSSQRSAELSEEVEEVIERTHDRRNNAPIPSERSQEESFSPHPTPATLSLFLLSLIPIFAR